MGIVVPDRAFRLLGVEPRRLQRTADSGRVNTRLVCPECGSWVCGTPRDGVVRVRAGTLAKHPGCGRHGMHGPARIVAFGANSPPSCEANKGLKLVTVIFRPRDRGAAPGPVEVCPPGGRDVNDAVERELRAFHQLGHPFG